MQPEATDVDSGDEYEGWDPLDSESDLDPELMTGWFGLNSSVSSFIRKVTENNARIDKHPSGPANSCCDIGSPNTDGAPLDLSTTSGSVDSSHLEILAKTACGGCLSDFSSKQLPLLPGAPIATAVNDQAVLSDGASLALVVRHLLLPAGRWRSIAGAVCILSIAIIGISYYICIYQSAGGRNAECPLVHCCPDSTKGDICHPVNASIIYLPVGKNLPQVKSAPAAKGDIRVSECLPSCYSSLSVLHDSTQRENTHLKQLLRELRVETARMRRVTYRLRMAHAILMKPMNSLVEHTQDVQTKKELMAPSVEISGQSGAMPQLFSKQRQIIPLNMLDASVSKLNHFIQKMHLLRSSANTDKAYSWQAYGQDEQATTKRIHKRIRKWTSSLSHAITVFVGNIEKTLHKMDDFVLSSVSDSSILGQVKDLIRNRFDHARAWSGDHASWAERLFASAPPADDYEQCARQKCSPFYKVNGAKQKVNTQEAKTHQSEHVRASTTSGRQSRAKSKGAGSGEDGPRVGWQFQASDQRRALRDRETYQSLSPSWIFRRSNKRGSLRHHDI